MFCNQFIYELPTHFYSVGKNDVVRGKMGKQNARANSLPAR